MINKAQRLFYTLWPLKLIQYWGLFYYRVLRRIVPFKPTSTKATEVESIKVKFHTCQPTGWKGGMEFKFLNNVATVDIVSWQASEQTLLWHYNLHYFDYLNAADNYHCAADQAMLILAWWKIHKPLQGIPWDPYPTSLRAVNLCKWGWMHNSQFELIAQDKWVAILDRHYQEVKRKLEYHMQANHFFTNLKALWFLQAALPEYHAKDASWLCRLVQRELRVQFDADGGHFELSPMYQRIMLWDLLDIVLVAKKVNKFQLLSDRLEGVVSKAFTWTKALSHPDNEVAFFNDTTIGIAPALSDLQAYTESLNIEIKDYIDGEFSGYLVRRVGTAKLICDLAQVGPAFQPGHAHADTLSFELSLGLQRIIVNSGTSEYGASPERLRQRSTSAHNTVALDNKNSSDVWSGFRVGRQAKIITKKTVLNSDESIIEAAHDGYKPVIHHRKWDLKSTGLVIHDYFKEPEKKTDRVKYSYLHLHPDVNVVQETASQFLLSWPNGKANLLFNANSIQLEIKSGTWHPTFDKVIKNKYLQFAWVGEQSKITVNWKLV